MDTKQEILNYLNSRHCPYSQINDALLINSESIKLLRHFPENSIDSCVTDGPYGIGFLGKDWDNFSPKAISKNSANYQEGIDHNLQSGRSASMHAGQYDTTRAGAIRFQHWTYEWAKEVYRVLKPGAHLISFCSPRMYHRMATGIEDAGFEIRDQLQFLFGTGMPKSHSISKAISKVQPDKAQRWDGYGTGLKPSNEPILLARKPICKPTVARNVLSHGTGGINIDACRIGNSGATKAVVNSNTNKSRRIHKGGISNDVNIVSLDKGRYPSNTIIDEEVAELLKDKSKFFYTAKVSLKERNAGCEHLVAKPQNCEGNGRTYNDRCAICGKKFTGSVESRCQCPPGVKKTDKTVYKNKNNHPTVKPIALMEYLVKLVTPKGGICMDLFMGSGGTGIACALASNNFQFIGIEREPDYYAIAKARIEYWSKQKKVA